MRHTFFRHTIFLSNCLTWNYVGFFASQSLCVKLFCTFVTLFIVTLFDMNLLYIEIFLFCYAIKVRHTYFVRHTNFSVTVLIWNYFTIFNLRHNEGVSCLFVSSHFLTFNCLGFKLFNVTDWLCHFTLHFFVTTALKKYINGQKLCFRSLTPRFDVKSND